MSKIILNYPLFDGEKVIENASVTIENGRIFRVDRAENVDSSCFLMPGLIDVHTHMSSWEQVRKMLQYGITATCDVCAPKELIESSKQLEIFGSAGMAMGMVLNPKGFVEKAAADGARYIKVLLFNSMSIGKAALRGIVKAAHEKKLKVAVHATEVATVGQAVDAGADILLHVPMKEVLPETLAKEIAQKKIAVAPTLLMMETFANSGKNGYRPKHYQNAENAVRLLQEQGVTILSGTDANPGSFAPAVAYGSSMHREMQLLAKAGLPLCTVLAGATGKAAEVFGLDDIGLVSAGRKATLLLFEGRPDKTMADIGKLKQMWINGEPIL